MNVVQVADQIITTHSTAQKHVKKHLTKDTAMKTITKQMKNTEWFDNGEWCHADNIISIPMRWIYFFQF